MLQHKHFIVLTFARTSLADSYNVLISRLSNLFILHSGGCGERSYVTRHSLYSAAMSKTRHFYFRSASRDLIAETGNKKIRISTSNYFVRIHRQTVSKNVVLLMVQ